LQLFLQFIRIWLAKRTNLISRSTDDERALQEIGEPVNNLALKTLVHWMVQNNEPPEFSNPYQNKGHDPLNLK